ncbi:hypothetical protein [Campylobacter helveticus]|uniref:hypothetical protein n=1 Tax=Campylobacter helveticus TaxID=28898 RepID=UPI0011129E77|nr:hypothetical protein [Campylobacter helveticus]MCR2065019.1 hypothetical protein [Campylobacter helveticus]MCR2066777.1 hypothetical protein [Campylobacter helveticus]TNB54452.1 hypothetical protein FDW47_07680 [Campylobacter helveticus]TNB59003.1 hypothetical protein FDR72_08965 [Campylobacter helveticus]
MLPALRYRIWEEDELSNQDKFVIENYLHKAKRELHPFKSILPNDDFEMDFCENFFDVKNGAFANNLNEEEKNFAIAMYKIINHKEFEKFKQGQVNFSDCVPFLKEKTEDLENNLKIKNEIEKRFKELGIERIKPDLEKEFIIKLLQAQKAFTEELENKFLSIQEKINSTFNLELTRLVDELGVSLKLEETQKELINTSNSSLDERSPKVKKYLEEFVFGMPLPKNCQEVINNDFVIFSEPLSEYFANQAKDELQNLNYQVSLFKDEKQSVLENSPQYLFAYAKDETSLQKALEYLKHSHNANQELSNQKTQRLNH